MKKIFALLFYTVFLFTAVACSHAPVGNGTATEDYPGGSTNETGETSSSAGEDFPYGGDPLAKDRAEYLSSVTYRSFVLTGENTPFYMGRWFDKEINGVTHKVTLTDGAHCYFLIENADSFRVDFSVITSAEEPYFAYSIDGGTPVRQRITAPVVKLPDNSRHTVRIIADGMTEGEGKWEKEKGFALRSVTPSDGGAMFGIRPTEKVVFFYGDSITEGIRALNMNANSKGNSATNAYAWQCAEALGVTPYIIGHGATGILSTGSFHTLLNTVDRFSKNRPADETADPDLIVINHGTNDGRYGADVFGEALTSALERLREKYPSVPIVYLIPFSGTHAQTISAVTERMENTYVIPTHNWNLTYTDGLHPDAAGAEKAGKSLASALKALFGEEYFLETSAKE